ncbi:hypothetical protein Esi_0679_0001 [Ectocarpus siliculosus]|uniref:Uncharacterized protein n=1 Tax=Ectocarpus siliculosus TaxID=2880 RepID=D7G5V2_ECTSI|nr:hypothetical protein Esi_0679_0001 [Ectocarpus siliculosus]|eukprot:CBJ33896.1 hypothetical protein Esi_0679_0001 [Ectocarpus siliculosus]
MAGGTGQAATQTTFRNPSSTMALVLTSQIQFLATLSFVDNTGAEDSALSGFTNALRWVNLWPSERFSEVVASRIFSSNPDQTHGEDDGDDDTTKRGMSVSFTNDLGSLLFMGNLALFAGLLAIIFSLHILVASAIEAHWLAKVLYPVLMFAMVTRTHRVRVRSDALIVFVSNENRVTSTGKKEFFSKLLAGSRNDLSLFTWADKGQWETVQTSDVNARRDADWFRIGFEPLFADFTQAGSWFILYTLMEIQPGWQVAKPGRIALLEVPNVTITFTGALTCKRGNFEVSLMKVFTLTFYDAHQDAPPQCIALRGVSEKYALPA